MGSVYRESHLDLFYDLHYLYKKHAAAAYDDRLEFKTRLIHVNIAHVCTVLLTEFYDNTEFEMQKLYDKLSSLCALELKLQKNIKEEQS